MRKVAGVLVAALALVAAACGDDEPAVPTLAPGTSAEEPEPEDGEPVTEFSWTTTLDQDGYGYVLVVDGFVGDGNAAYTMRVEPLLGTDGGDYSDLVAVMAGAAVNGFARPGEGLATDGGEISLDGVTEVRVIGDERWYRNPWLLEEAGFAMDGAEWVRVNGDEATVADLATGVLNERYDEALRRVRVLIEDGEAVQAPPRDEASTELDEVLTPWIGLAGPDDPVGAGSSVDGDHVEGELVWTDELTYEPDGADGELSGEVRWHPGRSKPPAVPDADDVVEVDDLTAQLAG